MFSTDALCRRTMRESGCVMLMSVLLPHSDLVHNCCGWLHHVGSCFGDARSCGVDAEVVCTLAPAPHLCIGQRLLHVLV